MWNDRYINPCSLLSRGAVFDPITALTLVGAGVGAAGTIMGGNAAAAAGKSQQDAANFQAAQQEQAAAESRAAAQRVALDKGRETRLLESKLITTAAASGASPDGTNVQNLAGNIAARGEYESLLEMYKGENKARGLMDAAAGTRMSGAAAAAEGEAKQNASYLSAAGTIIGSGGSAYRTYNRAPPKSLDQLAYG